MALKLDNNLLAELGLGQLPESEKQLLLRQIYEKLEMNVGMRLANQMSNEQLDAFEKFVDANDDKGAFQWLEANFPNYKLVVNEEFEKLKAEIASVAPQILASAQQQANAPQPQIAQQPQQAQVPPQSQQQVAPQQYQQPQQPSQPQPQAAPQSQQFSAPPSSRPAYQPQPPQPQQYQQQPAPGGAGAMPQSGHLQPQYGGTPADPVAQPQYQQPQPPQQYPPQPPAGLNQ